MVNQHPKYCSPIQTSVHCPAYNCAGILQRIAMAFSLDDTWCSTKGVIEIETQTRKAVFWGGWTNLKFQPGLSDLPSRLNLTIGFGISEVQALSKTFGNFFELAIDLHPQPLTTSLRLLDHLAWPPLTALGRPTVQVGLPQIALKLMPIAAIRAMATSARAVAIIK